MNSIFPVWKPIGITSYDVIRQVKKSVPNIKIGHCGTLDPFAEGILVLCTGDSTKKIGTILSLDKEYNCKIILGAETDSLDNTGEIIKECADFEIDKNNVYDVVKSFTGQIRQIPPYFSAIKVNGKKLYEFARKDIFIRLKPRKVDIKYIEVVSINYDSIELLVKCSKGTYIRSLARDIAHKLGTFGYVESLSRISIGNYDIKSCYNVEDVIKCLS